MQTKGLNLASPAASSLGNQVGVVGRVPSQDVFRVKPKLRFEYQRNELQQQEECRRHEHSMGGPMKDATYSDCQRLILTTPSELMQPSSSESSEYIHHLPRRRRDDDEVPPFGKQPLISKFAGNVRDRYPPAKIPMCIAAKVPCDSHACKNEADASGNDVHSSQIQRYIWSSPEFDQTHAHGHEPEMPPPKTSSVCTMTTASESESTSMIDHILETPTYSYVPQGRIEPTDYAADGYGKYCTTTTSYTASKRLGFALSCRRKPLRHEDDHDASATCSANSHQEQSPCPSIEMDIPTFGDDAQEDGLAWQTPRTPMVEHYAAYPQSSPKNPPRPHNSPNREATGMGMEAAMPMPDLSNLFLRR